MQYLWTHPEQAAAMGARAEERYHRLFTADRMADSYLRLYRDLTGK
jgi:rhamnosyl/mannosyltransferase